MHARIERLRPAGPGRVPALGIVAGLMGVFWVIGAFALLSLVWLHLVVRRMGPAEARQI